MVSYIVSAYDRPVYLQCCLSSLSSQTAAVDYEFIVTCNHTDRDVRVANQEVARRFDAPIHFTVDEGARDCYYAAEMAATKARGDWLCFPSDDSYYVPLFLDRMSAWMTDWDFIYCDMLYTSKWDSWRYSVMDVRPMRQHIDKTCFLVKRELFHGFPGKKNGAPCEADGELAEELVSRGVRHGKASGGALVVHN
jgi:hypothetical protein